MTRYPLLLLDAATPRFQAGLWTGPGQVHWAEDSREAGVAIFSSVEALLGRAGLRLEALEAFVFCEGPGSLLGLRSVCMALRVWSALRPAGCAPALLRYRSLDWLALRPPPALAGRARVDWVFPAGRAGWMHLASPAGAAPLQPPTRIPPEALAQLPGTIACPIGPKRWHPLPAGAVEVDYSVCGMEAVWGTPGFLRTTEAPEPWVPDAPSYRKWEGAAAVATSP